MKNVIVTKTVSLLLSFFLLAGIVFPALSVHAYAAESIISSATVSDLEKFGSTITDYLRQKLTAYETKIDVSSFRIPYNETNLNLIADYIFYQMPEAFHVSNLNFAGSGGNFLRIEPVYDMTKEEYLSLLSACEVAADTMLADIKNNTKLTDVDKMLLVHDRLALQTRYDERVFQAGGVPDESKNITGTLLKGLAQCQGYSMTFVYLLQKLGLQSCVTVSKGYGHMWNIAFLNNKPYHVDVTFDDPYPDLTGRVCHDHFLLSTAKLKSVDSARKNYNDFDLTPSDDTFENSIWCDSQSGIAFLNNTFYYVDTAGNVCRADTGEVIFSKTAQWKASPNSAWVSTYYHLCSAGNRLYFSDSTAVYRINPDTKKAEVFYTPTDLLNKYSYYSIFGFNIQNGILQFDFYNSPDLDNVTRSTYHYEISMDSISADWKNVGEGTQITYGSVDGDKEVTAADARLVLRYSVHLETFTDDQKKAADVDGIDGVTSADARLILRYAVKLETSFPVAG